MSDEEVSGLLVLDKPAGMTSHDVVARVRRVFGLRKVGHTGTLDPLASGVLLVLVGRATKRAKDWVGVDKEYGITAEFGWTTESLDADGNIVEKWSEGDLRLRSLGSRRVKEVLSLMVGEVEQEVPVFSAVKRGGEKLYEKARRGEVVKRPRRKVSISRLELESFRKKGVGVYPEVKLGAEVSSGTYTRVIVESLGRRLGVPAVQTALVRRRVGGFSLEESVSLTELEESSNPERWLRR